MERQRKHSKEIRSSGLFSRLLFLTPFKLLKKPEAIDAVYLHKLWPEFNSAKLGQELEKNRSPKSIVKTLWNCYGTTLIFLGLIQAIIDVTIVFVAQPYLYGKIVSYFTPGQESTSRKEVIVYGILLIGSFFSIAFYKSNYALLLAKVGIKIRIAMCSFLYRVILKSDHVSDEVVSGGKILTLITKDIQTIEMFTLVGNGLWTGVIKVIVTSLLLYIKIGVAGFVGVGCFVFGLPLQIYCASKVKDVKMRMCKCTDERLQTLQETITGIRLIKMLTWEQIFIEKINKARKKEMKIAFVMLLLRVTMLLIGAATSEGALYFMLLTYVWLGNQISAEIIYFIFVLFANLILIFCIALPDAIFKLFESLSATKRIQETLIKLTEKSSPKQVLFSSPKIDAKNLNVFVNSTQVLHNITLNINEGLTIITGPIGSGKSILLKTLLGNFTAIGQLNIEGTISYSSQEPWLFPSSIRKNILFGEDYHSQRYQEVLNVCALNYDFDQLKEQDATIVEDRGANLSKGQQARINLARAVYKDSNIYLLDDPLSSLDANVANHIFIECFQKFLRDKIVILVTHNLQFSKEAKQIFFFEKGEIKTLRDLNVLPEENLKKCEEGHDEYLDEETEISQLIKKNEKEMYAEEKKDGNVKWRVYRNYVMFGGGFLAFFFVFILNIIVTVLFYYRIFFMSNWVDLEEKLIYEAKYNETLYKSKFIETHRQIFITYGIIFTAIVLFFFLKSVSLILFTMRASIKIHKEMVVNIVRAKLQFFDENFLGNVMNKFSKDITAVDEMIALLLHRILGGSLVFVAGAILISLVNWMFLVPIICVLVTMVICKQHFTRTTTPIKRLDAITRSPIVGHLNATLEGLTTIKAFKAEKFMETDFDDYQNIHSSSSYAYQNSINALTFSLDFISSIFNAVVLSKFVFVGNVNTSAGYVGLAISQCSSLADAVNVTTAFTTELENQMTSIERCLEYTDIKRENLHGLDLKAWPEKGKISFESVQMTYPNSDDFALNNINFMVQPKEKIGIVGRTGAGKSSLISALFRMYEIKGKILIDDTDIKTVSLNSLRSSISIIPQEPILFSGTVRDNIDPFKKYSDSQIWEILETVNLKKTVKSLDTQIGTNELNFSVGQKQLLCVARAILEKNNILVLDEATSSSDAETEKLIHRSVEENFSECTVIIIAHKLQTVLKCDQILVLDKGTVVECGKPEILLKNKDGVFLQMVEAADLL